MKSDLVDLTLVKVHETEKAILVSETEDSEEEVWLPKSQIEIEPTKKSNVVVVTMPEHLAHSKGLI
jgi:hypothetical protein